MKVLLADDHPLFREGVKPVLQKLAPDLDLIEATDYPSAFNAMHLAREVDLALIDLYMPGMSGVEGVIRFRDTGLGIEPAVIDRIFEGFFTTKQEGTGAGLAFCKRTVESFNGSIICESQPKEYAEFIITLPMYTGAG